MGGWRKKSRKGLGGKRKTRTGKGEIDENEQRRGGA